jgi:polyisoprenoid-binding protein YceI
MDVATQQRADNLAIGGTMWTIDSTHSTIGFSIKHMLFATAHGRFGSFRGTIFIDELPDQSFVEVQIDADSIDTNEKRRDEHLRSSDFFDVTVYPTISLHSTRVELTSRLRSDRWRVVGDLTIHGITRSIELTVEQTGNPNPWDADVSSFAAMTKINRKDFGLGFNLPLDGGGLVIGDDVTIAIEIQAVKGPIGDQ